MDFGSFKYAFINNGLSSTLWALFNNCLILSQLQSNSNCFPTMPNLNEGSRVQIENKPVCFPLSSALVFNFRNVSIKLILCESLYYLYIGQLMFVPEIQLMVSLPLEKEVCNFQLPCLHRSPYHSKAVSWHCSIILI